MKIIWTHILFYIAFNYTFILCPNFWLTFNEYAKHQTIDKVEKEGILFRRRETSQSHMAIYRGRSNNNKFHTLKLTMVVRFVLNVYT